MKRLEACFAALFTLATPFVAGALILTSAGDRARGIGGWRGVHQRPGQAEPRGVPEQRAADLHGARQGARS